MEGMPHDDRVRRSGPSEMPPAPEDMAPWLEVPWRQLRFLVIQLACGFGVLVVVALALFRGAAGTLPFGLARYVPAAAAASVLDIVAGRLVLRRYLRRRPRRLPEGESERSAIAERVASGVLIVMALSEAPGLIGVATIADGGPVWILATFVALTAVGFASVYPTRARYVAWARAAVAARDAGVPPIP